MTFREELLRVFGRMLDRYGPQHWWPGDTRFEVMVGAILTQATAWHNVEKAISNLRAAGRLSPRALRDSSQEELARLIYSSGFYNAKARKLKAMAVYLGDRFDDDLDAMSRESAEALRHDLLGVHGIGEETADDILLYALGKSAFVVDNYTRRLFWRLGMAPENGPYATYRSLFDDNLPADPDLMGEFHALIVRHGKDVCTRNPRCETCCLLEICPTGQAAAKRFAQADREDQDARSR